MIAIDSNLLYKISNFLDLHTKEDKLIDLRDIIHCKTFMQLFLEDIKKQVTEIEIEFRNENIQYLLGQKNEDSTFHTNISNYLRDINSSPETISLFERLSKVIKENSYYPIEAKIKNAVQSFLDNYKGIHYYKNDNDKTLLASLIGELSDAIFYPCRLLDPSFDSEMNKRKNNIAELFLYINKTVHPYVGADQDAEDLLEKLINLKEHLDLN